MVNQITLVTWAYRYSRASHTLVFLCLRLGQRWGAVWGSRCNTDEKEACCKWRENAPQPWSFRPRGHSDTNSPTAAAFASDIQLHGLHRIKRWWWWWAGGRYGGGTCDMSIIRGCHIHSSLLRFVPAPSYTGSAQLEYVLYSRAGCDWWQLWAGEQPESVYRSHITVSRALQR